MAYNSWNIKQIKKQITRLSSLNMDDDTEILYSVLNQECDPFIFDVNKQEKKEMDDSFISEYSYYMKEIEKLSRALVKHRTRYLNNIEMSSIELLSVAHDYFKQFDTNWFRLFMSVFKDRKDNLIIGGNYNSSIYIPGIDYSYITVEKKDSIEDYFNLVHEYTHTIVDRMCYRSDYFSGYPFVELPSLLNEILLCDYLSKIYTGIDDDIKTYFNALFRTMVGYAKRISDYYYKHKDARDYMVKYLSYVIPMLEAIELYYVFLNDKEKGLYILNNIILMDNVQNYLEYTKSLGLKPNEHVKFIYDKFNKR